MNDADTKAFEAALVERCTSVVTTPQDFEAGWKAACEWRDSQVGESVMYQCRMQPTWTDRQPWTPWGECSKGTYEDCKRVRVDGDWRYESRALYTSTPTAQINQQLLEVVQKFVAWTNAELNHEGTTFQQRIDMVVELDYLADKALAAAKGVKNATD